MKYYKIIRLFERRRGVEVIRRGLTLAEARRHCNDPESSSMTSTCPKVKAKAKRWGRWFDAYEVDDHA